MKRRAQASIEYLVILGVVMIIASVVVMLLGGFISFGRSAAGNPSKLYWKTAEIGILDWLMKSNADDVLVVRNNQEYEIRISSISIGGIERPLNLTLVPGETGTVIRPWVSCDSGSSYAYRVVITYDNTEFGLVGKKFIGSQKLVGTCQ